jgi:aspartyl-tRNA(Asn)/glutamyl-tRNA(Gln) amidotransferase subunit B
MVHVGSSGRIHGSGVSRVDFNRGGTPLVEIVTEPDLRSASEAADWARLLRETVRQLGVSDVNMEEGSLRVDANVSVRPRGSEQLGTKTELKNMNSFRFLERGIDAELARQRELVAGGGAVVQETLHFDPASGSLTSLRSKEEAHDYRYLPEPDLVPLAPSEEMLREARESLPELPAARMERYAGLGLSSETATLLAADPETADYFERAAEAAEGVEPRVVANWVTGELAAALRQSEGDGAAVSRVEPGALASLVGMVQEKKISHGSGKAVLATLVAEGGDPAEIVEREGLGQISDSGELESIVAAAIEANPEAAEQIKGGNQKAIGAIVGAVMKETKGRADGGEVNRLIRKALGL